MMSNRSQRCHFFPRWTARPCRGDGPIGSVRRTPTGGFTLVELLVVIAIIGILVALLLPAVQTAREAARRIQCVNNLKQLGLAVNLHVSAQQDRFPAGNLSVCDDEQRRCARSSWTWSLLPYVEHSAIYEQYDDTLPNSYREAANLRLITQLQGLFTCPSDVFALKLLSTPGEVGPLNAAGYAGLAASSYKGVAGALVINPNNGVPVWRDRAHGGSQQYQALKDFSAYRGPLHTVSTLPNFRIRETKLRHVKDGTTKTFVIGEYFTRTSPDLKAVWGSPWRYHNKGHVHPESIYRTPDFDFCAANSSDAFICRRAFASAHVGTMLFAMCDGSVQSISEDVDGEVYFEFGSIASGGAGMPRRDEDPPR